MVTYGAMNTGTLALTLESVAPVLAEFGQSHAVIQKLEIFGSVAAGTASDESDLDLLITFSPETPRDKRYIDIYASLLHEVQTLMDCKVDLVDRNALRNDLFGFNARLHLKTVYERL
jgi:predicted nucleotidyltransferase